MRPLAGSDVFHLREEARGRPAHTLKVAILGPNGGVAPDPEAVAVWAAETLAERAPFRWRLATGAAQLGRPMWVDDRPGADHVLRRTLQGADPEGELDALLGALAGDQLPRHRPLWRLWVVDGSAAGDVALVLQMHHALADGAASVQIWEELFDPSADRRRPVPSGPARPLIAAIGRHARSLRDLPRLLLRLRRASIADRDQPPPPGRTASYFDAPPTVFNQPLSSRRACAFATLPLATLRDVRAGLGGTVNDVFAAVCSGALRSYLVAHDDLPAESLTATAPVGLERDGPYGNAMTTWFVRLATDEPDPRARYHAVRASLAAARALQERDPPLLHDLQEHTRLYDVTWRILGTIERRRGRPTFNVVISNVRGPDHLAWRGHPVTVLRSVGPLAGRMGLNLTAWSYGDDFTIGLHACRDNVGDLPRLAALLAEELEILAQLARREVST